METVERDFSDRGVQFFYIYKALAHPQQNGYATPFDLDERLQHIAEAKRKLGTRIPWLCDAMDNRFKHALGNAPNSEFVIDAEGKIAIARSWSSPDQLRQDLEELVGKPDQRTLVSDLDMPALEPPKTAPTGIVKRVEAPSQMFPLQVKPEPSDEPFYAKLRAELASTSARNDRGTLYLGFFLDPLYKVHWNNLAEPLRFEIELPDGVTLSETKGQGPSVEVDADADPREFLLEIAGNSDEPLRLTVHYFACDDAETFCKPVTQHYTIQLARDRDGGSRRTAGSRRGGRMGRPNAGGQNFPNRGRPRMNSNRRTSGSGSSSLRQAVAYFRQFDKDEDGRLNELELSQLKFDSKKLEMSSLDQDEDQKVSLQEMVSWLQDHSE